MDQGGSLKFHSVGEATMDAYHLVFFDMLRTIRVTQGEIDAEGVGKRLAFLLEYARMHFQSEEILMESLAYPALEPHRQEHQDFAARVEAMERRFMQQPSAALVGEILAFCESWFLEHIQGTDQAYEPFVRNHDRRARRQALRRFWAAGRMRPTGG